MFSDQLTKTFSAVCLLYAMEVAPHLNRPLGLVETSWGGTPIEAWSSSDAIAKCQPARMKRYFYRSTIQCEHLGLVVECLAKQFTWLRKIRNVKKGKRKIRILFEIDSIC